MYAYHDMYMAGFWAGKYQPRACRFTSNLRGDLVSQARYSGYAALFTFSIVLIVIFFGFQVWVVSLPLTILNSPAVSARSDPSFGTARDIVGIVLWGLGWLIESVADIQKVRVAPIGIHFTDSDPSPV